MYLILGNASDPCCAQVAAALRARGRDVRVIEGILSEPHRFMWRFAGGRSNGAGWSRIGVPGEWEADSSDIKGVLVRDTGTFAAAGWSEKDAQYMSAEMQAALLGWLWSLRGTVVNRAPAWLFYQPRPPFLAWVPMLHRAGLRTSVTSIGNDPQRLEEWRSRYAEGSILSPLASQTHYQVRKDKEWEAVMQIARHAPVLLEEAHGETRLACVVADRVIWDAAPPPRVRALEYGLRKFARSAGLNLLQVAVAQQATGEQGYTLRYTVVSVDANVQFPQFCSAAQQAITESLANLLTGSPVLVRDRNPVEAWRDWLVAGGAR